MNDRQESSEDPQQQEWRLLLQDLTNSAAEMSVALNAMRAAIDRLGHLKPAGIDSGPVVAVAPAAAPERTPPTENTVPAGLDSEGAGRSGATTPEPTRVTPSGSRPDFRAWPPRDDYNWPSASAFGPHASGGNENHHAGAG